MYELSFDIKKFVNSGPNFNHFIDLWDIVGRNAVFNIVKEVRFNRSKTNRSTTTIDKECFIWGIRSIFQYMIIVKWALRTFICLIADER